ncbi:MAG: hypothetical protein QOE37_631 [Microbacteriaceae bacterium]|jgi:hypothetical protein|nr:hypothetical protein [Microbacteriaceae bacterium]
MRRPYAHDVVLEAAETDDAAPGAAITVELCGAVPHEGPCPLAPHWTGAQRDGGLLRLRILFAAEPDREAEVRARIGAALGGREPEWRLVTSEPGELRPGERAHANRIAAS